ncbi:MAG: NUDIX domain-containing protein [Chloroflexi bacterium]|nr:NUDIX domain-containing protein [Chloroflexota bacterium]
MIHINARALIERATPDGTEIVIQIRNKPAEGGKRLELPGGRIEEFESLVVALTREVREETGLELTHIEGIMTRIETQGATANVECLAPFAVYQTLKGTVDSLGIYFRCRARGELLRVGDDTEAIRWVAAREIAQWLARDPEQFSWVDRAGLQFYLRQTTA